MIKLNMPVIVEGKYDKIKLANFIDAVIIETDGFRIFKNAEKRAFIKKLAIQTGIIVMTDSDSAGFKIRNFIRNIAKDGTVINVYIPDVMGKEKRKTEPSKEGKLGVEGLSEEIITQALEKAGVFHTESEVKKQKQVTLTDFYIDGISGNPDAKKNRQALLKMLDLPQKLSTSQLLKLINAFMTYDDYKNAVQSILNS